MFISEPASQDKNLRQPWTCFGMFPPLLLQCNLGVIYSILRLRLVAFGKIHPFLIPGHTDVWVGATKQWEGVWRLWKRSFPSFPKDLPERCSLSWDVNKEACGLWVADRHLKVMREACWDDSQHGQVEGRNNHKIWATGSNYTCTRHTQSQPTSGFLNLWTNKFTLFSKSTSSSHCKMALMTLEPTSWGCFEE